MANCTGQGGNSMWGSMGEYGMGGYGLWGGLVMVLFWGIIIILVIAVVRWLMGDRHSQMHEHSNRALEILEERYARGEIEREEYLQRRDDLKR